MEIDVSDLKKIEQMNELPETAKENLDKILNKEEK